MERCKHTLPWKDHKMYCMAYHELKPENQRKWTQCPPCKDENCPLKHPELLETNNGKEEA